jgi:hypothetical protein
MHDAKKGVVVVEQYCVFVDRFTTLTRQLVNLLSPQEFGEFNHKNVYFPSIGYGPEPCRSSVCSFHSAHYGNLVLDIAVSEHGVLVHPTERVVSPCAGVAINNSPD